MDALLHVFADPKVRRTFDSEPFDQAQMERWVRRNLEHQERYGYGLYSVILRENDLLIGVCGLAHMEVDVKGGQYGAKHCPRLRHRAVPTRAPR